MNDVDLDDLNNAYDTLRSRLAEVTRERDEAVAKLAALRSSLVEARPLVAKWYGKRELSRLDSALANLPASISKRLEYVAKLKLVAEEARTFVGVGSESLDEAFRALSAVDAVKE